jgi:hypothetical protein
MQCTTCRIYSGNLREYCGSRSDARPRAILLCPACTVLSALNPRYALDYSVMNGACVVASTRAPIDAPAMATQE